MEAGLLGHGSTAVCGMYMFSITVELIFLPYYFLFCIHATFNFSLYFPAGGYILPHLASSNLVAKPTHSLTEED